MSAVPSSVAPLPATIIGLRKQLLVAQQVRSQIFHGWSMLFLIMLRSDSQSRNRDANARPSPLNATTAALYHRALALIVGRPFVPGEHEAGAGENTNNPGITPADFNTLVSSTVVPRLQRVNEEFRAVTAPTTEAPNPHQAAVFGILSDPANASVTPRLVDWCSRVQEVEKRRFELVVAYQQAVVAHLSETYAEGDSGNHSKHHGGGKCCHESAKVTHLSGHCVFLPHDASEEAVTLPSSLISSRVALADGIRMGLQWTSHAMGSLHSAAPPPSVGGITVSDSEEEVAVGGAVATTSSHHPCIKLGAWVKDSVKELSALATKTTDLIDECKEELIDA